MSTDASLPNGVAPMTIEMDDEVINDLRQRVRRARRPERMLVVGREDPARLQFINDLIDYWARSFDWRLQERRLKRLPHFRATVGGIGIHFLWLRSPRSDATPLLLTNGWPSCFLEYVDVIDALADGDGADSVAFDVVVPTMPGYGLSEPALEKRIDEDVIADLWAELMRTLDYPRFYAHGDDFGGRIASRIAWRHPDAVAGLHISEPLSPERSVRNPSPVERNYLESLGRWREQERSYGAIAATRPQTLALALDDSPLGLAAWLSDKYLSWSDPATLSAWTPDRVLGFVTLYWTTRAIAPSMRPTQTPRQSFRTSPWSKPRQCSSHQTNRGRRRHVCGSSEPTPTYASTAAGERGGHFTAIEHPEGFIAELRCFFGQLESER
jgi:epoxide hydrolase